MPTLVRLLTTLGILAGLVFAIMAALVYLVEPRQRLITVDVPLTRPGSPPPALGQRPSPDAEALRP